ncbi:hypothetical protein Tco_1060116 [Tanacetum coccineum]
MLCLDFHICAQDKNFSSICAYTNNDASESLATSWGTMCYCRDLVTLMLPCQLSMGEDVGLGEGFRNFAKKESMKKAFQDMLHELGEVNPVHAYYNGSCTSKDTEDPSWSISFKTRRTRKTSSALEALWKTLFVLYLYMIGTFEWVYDGRSSDSDDRE